MFYTFLHEIDKQRYFYKEIRQLHVHDLHFYRLQKPQVRNGDGLNKNQQSTKKQKDKGSIQKTRF
jgi:hypothetical protein